MKKRILNYQLISYFRELIDSNFNIDSENNIDILINDSKFDMLSNRDIIFLINISERLESNIKYLLSLNKNYNNERILKLIDAYQTIKALNEKADNYFEEPNNNSKIEENVVNYYLNELPSKVLTFEEIVLLYKKYEQGDLSARNQIINYNLRLVVSVAKKYKNMGIEFEDLISAGNEGLLIAVEKYDYTLGISFSSYARWWIMQYVTRTIANNSRTIRIPVHLHDLLIKVRKYMNDYYSVFGKNPSIKEISNKFNINSDLVETILNVLNSVISLNEPICNNGESEIEEEIGSTISSDIDIEEEYIEQEMYNELNKYVFEESNLSERDKKIIAYRYGFIDGKIYTLDEIGNIYHICKERVRQIENSSIKKLKKNKKIQSLNLK